MTLVSCIIIFLNGEKFIEEAIESIFSQTYSNWELLLVDDGSTDNSTQIALNYVAKYPGETHLKFIDKTPFLCIDEGIGIYRLINFFRVIMMV